MQNKTIDTNLQKYNNNDKKIYIDNTPLMKNQFDSSVNLKLSSRSKY